MATSLPLVLVGDGNAVEFTLRDQAIDARLRLEFAGSVELLGLKSLGGNGAQIQLTGTVASLGGLLDEGGDPDGIEVDVGKGGEERLDHKLVNGVIPNAELGCAMGKHGYALEGVHEKILQGCGIVILAADANLRASLAFGGLFTLVTEHLIELPFVGLVPRLQEDWVSGSDQSHSLPELDGAASGS